jgi:3'-5' exonuclease
MSAVPLQNILFLDIETAAQYPSFDQLPEEWKELWVRKSNSLIRDRPTETAESVYDMAGLYAEFGKVICISCGIISKNKEDRRLLLKSFYASDEREVLLAFCEMVSRWGAGGDKFLCAHNGKEFDYPYLCRRLIIHGIQLPALLDPTGRKRWELPHLDTLEWWKFGEYKNFTSLHLLSLVLGIPSPKDDIDGSMVNGIYWKEKDLARIAQYCQKDVVTLAQVYLKWQGESLLSPEQIEIK